jgi:hypothetical protein
MTELDNLKEAHILYPCYVAYVGLDNGILKDVDEICEQLWAEIKIMRTLKVKDLDPMTLR